MNEWMNKNFKAESKHSPEIRLLIKSKTLERVKRRIKYLGFKIPFQLEWIIKGTDFLKSIIFILLLKINL